MLIKHYGVSTVPGKAELVIRLAGCDQKCLVCDRPEWSGYKMAIMSNPTRLGVDIRMGDYDNGNATLRAAHNRSAVLRITGGNPLEQIEEIEEVIGITAARFGKVIIETCCRIPSQKAFWLHSDAARRLLESVSQTVMLEGKERRHAARL